MTGMGELLSDVSRRAGVDGAVVAVDISPCMCEKARRYEQRRRFCPVRIVEADALNAHQDMPSGGFNVIVSSFGLKTFSSEQLSTLAQRIHILLRPGGRFSMLEISVPSFRLLRTPYLFYLGRVIPIMGKLFLGNPDNYRMLGLYTKAFENCDRARELLEKAGLQVETRKYFFGCATGVVGRKPESLA
jgi:demethylmenaquinone methyltransferase/2-methoxy-6-polyprenyl-1,4-benzoquinol methylase